jgi:hypothetical protein
LASRVMQTIAVSFKTFAFRMTTSCSGTGLPCNPAAPAAASSETLEPVVLD